MKDRHGNDPDRGIIGAHLVPPPVTTPPPPPGGGHCTRPPEGWTCSRGADHEGPCAARTAIDDIDPDRAERVLGGLDKAKPGDMFAFQQASGKRVILVVARYQPTGVARTTGVNE